jgi:hypothetical protein
MDEEQYHIDAFETYYILRQSGMTKTDAVAGVSKEHERSKSAVWEWKKEFDWDEKVAIRAAKINKNIQDKTDSTIEENKSSYLGIIHTSLNKYIADVKNGSRPPIEINSSQDLVRLITKALEIQDEGELTKPLKVEVENKGKNSDIPDQVVKEFGSFLIHRERDKDLGTDSG